MCVCKADEKKASSYWSGVWPWWMWRVVVWHRLWIDVEVDWKRLEETEEKWNEETRLQGPQLVLHKFLSVFRRVHQSPKLTSSLPLLSPAFIFVTQTACQTEVASGRHRKTICGQKPTHPWGRLFSRWGKGVGEKRRIWNEEKLKVRPGQS